MPAFTASEVESAALSWLEVSAVPGYGVEIWVGVFAPAGTPAAFGARVRDELALWKRIVAQRQIRIE